MDKAARDRIMPRLSQTERGHFRHFIQEVRTRTAVSGLRVTARQVLTPKTARYPRHSVRPWKPW